MNLKVRATEAKEMGSKVRNLVADVAVLGLDCRMWLLNFPDPKNRVTEQADGLVAFDGSLNDAVADLGQPQQISTLFTTFQKFLYEQPAPATPT